MIKNLTDRNWSSFYRKTGLPEFPHMVRSKVWQNQIRLQVWIWTLKRIRSFIQLIFALPASLEVLPNSLFLSRESWDVGNLIYFWQSVVMSLGVPGYKNQFYLPIPTIRSNKGRELIFIHSRDIPALGFSSAIAEQGWWGSPSERMFTFTITISLVLSLVPLWTVIISLSPCDGVTLSAKNKK